MTPPPRPIPDPRHISPGLSTIRALCGTLGNPEQDFPAVLVAGTNGKGSAAAMLESILRRHGLYTGLTTSPHLIRETERIRLQGVQVGEAGLARLRVLVDAAADAAWVHPTYFEQITAAAFVAFAEARVQRAVVEVGLGGRWDATWVAHADVGLVTSISLEHTAWLGDTVQKIAREKAAIARPGMTLYSAVERDLHDEAIAPEALACGTDRVVHLDDTGWRVEGETFTSPGGLVIQPPLAGDHMAKNAALAALAAAHVGVPEATIKAGLEAARWPGRYETLATDPLLVADVAHNPDAFRALVATQRKHHPRVPFQVVLGLKPDKDVAAIAPFVGVLGDLTHVVGGGELRDADELAEMLRANGVRAVARGRLTGVNDLIAALRNQGTNVLACGSHHLVGAVLPHYRA
jgi:dihydrofolate synthase/folylpolyglutamate synthase